jgi:SAM-dependent methyltransferase
VQIMGVYGEQVLPRIIDVVCNMKANRPQRRRVCDGLAGDVVEIGFGSGLNVPFYPAAVAGVAAVEPADVGWKLAAKRLGASAVPVERSGLDGQSLPFPDDRFDAALSTWTMCTIPDIDAALRELRRVLKPGGTLHFVEHGLAPDAGVRRWQHRLEPVQKRLFGGCHLTRPIADLLTGAGFAITELDVYYETGAPKLVGANSLGVAQSP